MWQLVLLGTLGVLLVGTIVGLIFWQFNLLGLGSPQEPITVIEYVTEVVTSSPPESEAQTPLAGVPGAESPEATVSVEERAVTVEVLPTPSRTPSPSPTPRPARQERLVVCMGEEPDTLHPYASYSMGTLHIQQALYDGPIDFRSFGYHAVAVEKVPSLADGDAFIETTPVGLGDLVVDDAGDPVTLSGSFSGKLRPAGCRSSDCAVTYTGQPLDMDVLYAVFTLREGLTWADGQPVKASDSVYAFTVADGTLTDEADRYLIDRTQSYESPEDRTLLWIGLPGFLDPTYQDNMWTPLPEHHLADIDIDVLLWADQLQREPLGYGAYTAKEWVDGSHFTVERNPYYFRAGEGLPLFEEVVFRFLGYDSEVAVTALLAGDCDILTDDTFLWSQVAVLLDLEAEGEVETVIAPSQWWEHVDFGINPPGDYAATRPDFFEDARMRQAVALCLDRQAVVDELFYGRSVVLDSYLPPYHPLYEPGIQKYAYDPEQGQELLDDLGWIDTDSDGLRECQGCSVEGAEDGTPLAFTWRSSRVQLRADAMQMFGDNLRECGMDVTVENLDGAEWFSEEALFGRRFDLGQYSWDTGSQPLCDLYLCSEWGGEDPDRFGINMPGYCNPEYDRLCRTAMGALPGTAEYEQAHSQVQRLFGSELPSLPLYPSLLVAAHRPGLEGLILDASMDSEMWNIEEFVLQP